MNAEEEEEDDDDDDVILMKEASPPTDTVKDLEEDEGRKQATTHISVSPEVVLACCREKGDRQPHPSKGYHRFVTSRENSSQGEGSPIF